MKSSCKVKFKYRNNNINNNNNNNNNNNDNNNNFLFCLFHFHPTGHITSFQIFSTLFKNNFSIMLVENVFRIFFQAFVRFVSFILYCSMFRILFIKFMFSWAISCPIVFLDCLNIRCLHLFLGMIMVE